MEPILGGLLAIAIVGVLYIGYLILDGAADARWRRKQARKNANAS